MVHGLLHLLGHDHEGPNSHTMGKAMAAAEQSLINQLSWEGSGLITAAGVAAQGDISNLEGGCMD